ncbi:hypothetical protein EV207_12247 [Scopulibacillus darangshiensis]|uniref:Uncharacterized protein n=1 Tax=Scopulibacillus darangshiensis TaxID=442528 RepID=A0A4R2NTX7_9BACL|nr:DUF6220 domain-containing protein [Scopulibacillus darangshiensis]TCP24944.1 hypothetical protein EV207_12247 [Scopulibacillus darangshiensis]
MNVDTEYKKGAETKGVSAVARFGRMAYRLLAWVFLICIIAQVFIAGMATFTGQADWGLHMAFVKFFAPVPIIMILLSIIGRIRIWLSLGLFALIVFQFMSVELFSSVWVLAALHPVVALLLFWGAIVAVKQARGK